MRQETPPVETFDLWEMYCWDEGGRVPCKNARRLLMFLASPSTKFVERWPRKEGSEGGAYLCISGPTTDDGEMLFGTYHLTQSEIHVGNSQRAPFTYEEKRALKNELLRLRVCDRGPKNELLKDPVGQKTKNVINRLGLNKIS